jgi:hypothetical protein
VDGKDVFPKLPAYLRTYHSDWQRGQAASRTATEAAAGAQVLHPFDPEITNPKP